MKHLLKLLIVCGVFASCRNSNTPPAVSFYYWRTTFELSENERQTLKENGVSRIYIRYFDVDLGRNNNPLPESPIRFHHTVKEVEIVPVVYIKNRVMLQNELDIETLADNIIGYINQIDSVAGNPHCNEIQIDCDWTLKSRDRFMQFVKTVKEKSGKRLSATIRLHQVKHYAKTLIPDVEKGVLMYYNMGKIAADTLNSIYDRNIALSYIKSLSKYPLQLDIALPIYAWGVHIREGKVINLISKMDEAAFRNDSNFVSSNHSETIETKHSNIKQGHYFLRGDRLKIEKVSEKELLQMASDIRKNLRYTPDEVIFFDLDEINSKRYEETNFFETVARRF